MPPDSPPDILPSVALFWTLANVVFGIVFGFIGRFFYRRQGVYVEKDEYRFAFFASVGSLTQFCISSFRSQIVFGEPIRGGYWAALWSISFYSASIVGFRLSLRFAPIKPISED